MVIQEEEHHAKCNDLNTTSKAPKKNKGKRIPQRGLGVEKLEKLRMEEQQKFKTSTTLSNSNPSSTILQIPEFNPLPQNLDYVKQDMGNVYPLNGGFSLSNHEEIKHQPFWLVTRTKSVAIEPPSNQNYISNYNISSLNADTSTMPPYMNHSEPMLHRKNPFRIDFSSVQESSSSDVYQNHSRSSEVQMNKRKKESSASEDGGFLSLGSSSSTQSTMRSNSPLSNFPSRPFLHPQFSAFQYQGGRTNTMNQCSNGQVFYSFLPMVSGVQENKANDQNDDIIDGVDTRLKL